MTHNLELAVLAHYLEMGSNRRKEQREDKVIIIFSSGIPVEIAQIQSYSKYIHFMKLEKNVLLDSNIVAK